MPYFRIPLGFYVIKWCPVDQRKAHYEYISLKKNSLVGTVIYLRFWSYYCNSKKIWKSFATTDSAYWHYIVINEIAFASEVVCSTKFLFDACNNIHFQIALILEEFMLDNLLIVKFLYHK